ncbi:hypothetical protein RD792_016215 [Penstemon davidsonii]|uniref:Stress enhanced protein 1 n=1 Tax=Penstemon davidsonii TaxID=160366 RepID=A0ABR0CKD1_9LAMI|nr:hypothetical protein RD792_016215 [Penstemon davidsonii]
MAAITQISSSLCCYSSVHDISFSRAPKSVPSALFPRKFGTAFATGSSLLIQRPFHRRNSVSNSKSVTIKCEQSTEGGGVDVWLGRVAMIGFAVALSVEVATGKGLLENFGLITPLPTVALAVTALVGVLTAIFIFQSASKN